MAEVGRGGGGRGGSIDEVFHFSSSRQSLQADRGMVLPQDQGFSTGCDPGTTILTKINLGTTAIGPSLSLPLRQLLTFAFMFSLKLAKYFLINRINVSIQLI